MSKNSINSYSVKFKMSKFELYDGDWGDNYCGSYDEDSIGYHETSDLFQFFLSESECGIGKYVSDWEFDDHHIYVSMKCTKSQFEEFIDYDESLYGYIPDFKGDKCLYCSVSVVDYNLKEKGILTNSEMEMV
jgi:hypothetical protein